MHLLHEGGEYLRRAERRLWWYFGSATAAAAGVGLLVPVVGWYVLFAIPVAYWLADGAASRLGSVRRGRVGERLVTNLLRRLPDDYYVVNDVMLDGAAGNIDHVVVGPCGVVVIETKRLAGVIRCHGDDWYVNGFKRRSFSRQAKRNAIALRAFLREHHPDVYTGFVEAIVVFTYPLCRVQVNGARAIVARYSELHQVMIDLGRRRSMSPEVAQRLAESLAAWQASSAPRSRMAKVR